MVTEISAKLMIAPTAEIDLSWRQAVCRHLSTRIAAQPVTTNLMSWLATPLQALYPRYTPIQWPALQSILQEIVDLVRQLRGEKDIYVGYLPKRGDVKNDYTAVRSSNQSGHILVCLFPSMVRRLWIPQSQQWREVLLTAATVCLESTLAEG
jgi:hypothetical protein